MVAFAFALMALMSPGQTPAAPAGAPTVSISGEVMRSGQAVLTDGLTVGALVESAGGFLAPHVDYEVTIVRRSSDPNLALSVQCLASLSTPLKNGDVIFVGRSRAASKELTFLKRINCDKGGQPK